MAGHSKWAQIKRKKAVTDARRGKLFSKLAREIQLAAQNSPDPERNTALRVAIDQARAANMPSTNIERAIRKGSGKEGASLLEEVWYGGFGQGGVGFLVRVLTDNKKRTVAELKHLFTKNKGQLVDTNSVEWMFERRVGDDRIIMIPKTRISLKDELTQEHQRLLSELEDHRDVQEVFTNAQ